MKEQYIISEKEVLLEQYKIYVEMADRISARRSNTNNFYITLLTALLLLLSTISEKNMFSDFQMPIVLMVSFLGIALCYIWHNNIQSYRQLNRAKFKIIQEMEKKLPFHCYTEEWDLLGKGEDSKKYLQLTAIESHVPKILAIPYSFLLVYSLLLIVYSLFRNFFL